MAATRDAVERFGDRMAAWALVRPKKPESLPVRIGRNRIYVLPTGFGLFLGAMLVTMLVGGLNYNNNPALLLVFLLAGPLVADVAPIRAGVVEARGRPHYHGTWPHHPHRTVIGPGGGAVVGVVVGARRPDHYCRSRRYAPCEQGTHDQQNQQRRNSQKLFHRSSATAVS